MVVALIAAAVYLPTLRAGFVYDDSGAIVDNPYIHDQRNLGDVLTGRVLARDVMDNNRPLCLLSTMADVAVWGDRPMGFHLTNVLLHAATAALLALLLMRLLAARVPSGGTVDGGPRRGVQLAAICGAVVFAVHPVTSEAVCVPSFREELLVAFFIVLGLNLAAAFPGRSRAATWLLGATVTLCLLAAVASKESGIAGAALLTLYVWLFRRTEWDARWAWMLAGAWLTGAGFLVARFLLAPASSAIFVTATARRRSTPAGRSLRCSGSSRGFSSINWRLSSVRPCCARTPARTVFAESGGRLSSPCWEAWLLWRRSSCEGAREGSLRWRYSSCLCFRSPTWCLSTVRSRTATFTCRPRALPSGSRCWCTPRGVVGAGWARRRWLFCCRWAACSQA